MTATTDALFEKFQLLYPAPPGSPWQVTHWTAAREAWGSVLADGADAEAIIAGVSSYGAWCEGRSHSRVFAPRNYLLRREWRTNKRGGETATARATELLAEPTHVSAFRALGDIAALLGERPAADREAAEAQVRRWPTGQMIDAARSALNDVYRMEDAAPAEIAAILHAALDHLPSSARRAAIVRHVAEIEPLPAPLAVQAMRRLIRRQKTSPTVADLAGALAWSFSARDVMADLVIRLVELIDTTTERYPDPEWAALMIALGHTEPADADDLAA